LGIIEVKRLISFSGGKDSTALILWAKENLDEFDVIFCDTNWEHPITYGYIEYIDKTLLNGKLITLKSDKYDGFVDMSIKKGRVPSTVARFCTEELKLKPVKKFIESLLPDVEIYLGIRADESASRSKLTDRAYADYYNCDLVRPLIRWTVEDVFAIHKKYNIEPNPLYKMGMKRVGCMPCIMTNLKEIKNIAIKFPEIIDGVRDLEQKLNTSFYPPNAIPKRYMTGWDKKSGKAFPWVDDIVTYVLDDPDQIKMFPDEEAPKCMSYYSICE